MRRVTETIFLIVIFVFFGCENKITEDEFEQSIFDNLFTKIVDSTYIDQRLYTCLPEQGKSIYDESGKWIGLDSVGQHQRDLECEIKRFALKKDTLSLIIAIKSEGLLIEETNLSKYNNLKYIFKHLNEHPRGKDLEYTEWKNTYGKFAGVMSFSHIEFDSKKEAGTIKVTYSCGGNCGLSYLVYIKKVLEKWVIYKVEETSIS